MITRTYVVEMPEESPTAPLDILVESAPGSPDAPVIGDGIYFEWRGRPLRIPVLAADGVAEGFVPRLRLGFSVTITPVAAAVSTDLPSVQLSESLVGTLASTDSGPSLNVPTLSDPGGEAAIRLIGSADTSGLVYLVTLMCPEAKDEDRSNTGL